MAEAVTKLCLKVVNRTIAGTSNSCPDRTLELQFGNSSPEVQLLSFGPNIEGSLELGLPHQF